MKLNFIHRVDSFEGGPDFITLKDGQMLEIDGHAPAIVLWENAGTRGNQGDPLAFVDLPEALPESPTFPEENAFIRDYDEDLCWLTNEPMDSVGFHDGTDIFLIIYDDRIEVWPDWTGYVSDPGTRPIATLDRFKSEPAW